ncbi:FliM/FliN family flagellar motor switch protein, partial [Fretibacterium fastidiosum]
MDDLLSQDEINALLSGGDLGGGADSDLSMEDSHLLGEVSSIFAGAESSVIGMLSGKEVDTAVDDAEVVTQADFRGSLPAGPFLFTATFGGFDDIPLALAVEQRGALTLADLMMGGEGKDLPDEPSDLYLNAAQEGLSQVVGSSFTSLSGLLGGKRLIPENTTSGLASGDWLAFSSMAPETKLWMSPVEVKINGLDPFKIWVALPLDSALKMVGLMREIIGEQEPQQPEEAAAPAPSPAAGVSAQSGGGMRAPMGAPAPRASQQPTPIVDVHPAAFQPLGGAAAGGAVSPIDMIADIPVRVTVELGKTRKSVSEVLALTSGSVIELDKMA